MRSSESTGTLTSPVAQDHFYVQSNPEDCLQSIKLERFGIHQLYQWHTEIFEEQRPVTFLCSLSIAGELFVFTYRVLFRVGQFLPRGSTCKEILKECLYNMIQKRKNQEVGLKLPPAAKQPPAPTLPPAAHAPAPHAPGPPQSADVVP